MPIAPKYMQNNAARGLRLRKQYGRGGLSAKQAKKAGVGSGVQRAVNIKNGNNLSLRTLKRMKSFLARNMKNAKRKRLPNKEPSAGYVAQLLWGGSGDGRALKWVTSQINKIEKKK